MNIRFAPNTLYYGDCLDILADFPDTYVDLICLDPPFNSNAKYSTEKCAVHAKNCMARLIAELQEI